VFKGARTLVPMSSYECAHPKNAERSDPANYRSVSMTCIICKLQLAGHILCTHKLIHSCEPQFLLTTHDLFKNFSKALAVITRPPDGVLLAVAAAPLAVRRLRRLASLAAL